METQIFELLGRRSAMPAREDVLAVLASLDPPESYMPDDLREALAGGEGADIPWRQIPQRVMQRGTVAADRHWRGGAGRR